MLVLVISQTETSVPYFFHLKLHIIPGVTKLRIYFLINYVPEGPKKSKVFWLASVLVEAGAGQDTGICMPPKRDFPAREVGEGESPPY